MGCEVVYRCVGCAGCVCVQGCEVVYVCMGCVVYGLCSVYVCRECICMGCEVYVWGVCMACEVVCVCAQGMLCMTEECACVYGVCVDCEVCVHRVCRVYMGC